jgi:FdhE protein
MSRTAGGIRSDTTTRLRELQQLRPEWQTWLRLLSLAEQVSREDIWRTAVDPTDPQTTQPSAEPAATPLLHRRRLHVNGSRVQRLVRELASAASGGGMSGSGTLNRYRPSVPEALELLSAAVSEDGDRIEALADGASIDAGALATVAHLAAYPVLQSCGHLLDAQVPTYWPHGYCPVCAAWPILAERRGLDRSRRLRCGRCAAQWEVQWLYCIYCGERNHEQLGSLQTDEQGDLLKVETCTTCQGYLKSIATLQGFSGFDLLLKDLETVEFDLVALDRGYSRPRESGLSLEVQIHDASRRAV